ncbi:MAG TPA: hypothetical protein VFO86_14440, partial [Terriglobia bacterium]|nr:hypothetical protein [Terriglobia bacterium]
MTVNDTIDVDGDSSPDTVFTVQIRKELTAIVNLDIHAAAVLGEVQLFGPVEIRALAELNIVFGFDGSGFFIAPNLTAGHSELKLSNFEVDGDITASGRLGSLGVDLKKAEFTVDPDVAITFDLVDPGTDAADGKIRGVELFQDNVSNLFNVAISGDPGDGVNDFVLTGTFGVKAVIPGFDANIDLGEAKIILSWADANHPEQISVSAAAVVDQEFVDFLQVTSQKVLDGLNTIKSTLDIFDTDFPFVSDNLDNLISLVNTFQTKVLDRITDPIGGGASTPTLQQLATKLASSLGIDLADLGLSYGKNSTTGDRELTYSPKFDLSFEASRNFDFGLGADSGAKVDVNATADLKLTFGVDVDGLLALQNPLDFFFIRGPDFNGTLDVSASNLTASATAGPISIGIENGTVTGHVAIGITLKDPGTTATPASAGRIDLRELVDNLIHPSSLIDTFDISGSASMTDISMSIGGLVSLSGDFSFASSNDDLKKNDGTLIHRVNHLVIGGAGINGFFGVNGPYVDPGTTPNAVGLSLTGIDFTFLRVKDESGTTPVNYTAFKTHGGSAAFV